MNKLVYIVAMLLILAACDRRYTESEFLNSGGRGGIVVNIISSTPGEQANTSDKLVLIRYGADGYCEIQFSGKTDQWYIDHGVVEHQVMDLKR